MMPVIFPFGEGKTEKVIFDFLISKWFLDGQFRNFISVNGKNNFRSKIEDTVQSEVNAGRDEIRILVFRDLDNGEEIDSIVQSFENIVSSLIERWNVKPNMSPVQDGTVYKWEVDPNPDSDFAGLRLVLHIANHREKGLPVPLRNHTSDGYILSLALDSKILERFAGEIGGESENEISSDSLRSLVIDEIPNIVRGNNIRFDEDKDYLSAYLTATRFWVVKRTEEKARLVRIILERAWEYNQDRFEQVFASWRTAIEEVAR